MVDKQQVAGGQSLPGGGPAGFPHIVVDVCFLRQVEPEGFGLEQKLPGTGHLYGFAKLATCLDLNSEVLHGGADQGEGDGSEGWEEFAEAGLLHMRSLLQNQYKS